ncbi:MAG: pyridoxamine 5'-phosphate oxidase family protein [Litoreibacter sp.]
MNFIETIEDLEALYGTPGEASLVKVAKSMTPLYREWIAASRFCLLSTAGAEGTDCSPRGDDRPVVMELDPNTLGLPDWRGNQRLDSLRNIVTDGRVSLAFMVPGNTNVVRVNGEARLSADTALRSRFERRSILPTTVCVIKIHEIYIQCARALMRSELWTSEHVALPSVGDLLREQSGGRIDGKSYDRAWPDRALKTMW